VGGSQALISYHLFVRNQEIFDYFIDVAWLISQRPIEYNYSVGLTPIELNALQMILILTTILEPTRVLGLVDLRFIENKALKSAFF
jgi:hypothetical protein